MLNFPLLILLRTSWRGGPPPPERIPELGSLGLRITPFPTGLGPGTRQAPRVAQSVQGWTEGSGHCLGPRPSAGWARTPPGGGPSWRRDIRERLGLPGFPGRKRVGEESRQTGRGRELETQGMPACRAGFARRGRSSPGAECPSEQHRARGKGRLRV